MYQFIVCIYFVYYYHKTLYTWIYLLTAFLKVNIKYIPKKMVMADKYLIYLIYKWYQLYSKGVVTVVIV